MTFPTELPPEIRQEVAKRGLSAVLDDVAHREGISRNEMLHWKRIRLLLQAEIQFPIDELSEVAEKAFKDVINS